MEVAHNIKGVQMMQEPQNFLIHFDALTGYATITQIRLLAQK